MTALFFNYFFSNFKSDKNDLKDKGILSTELNKYCHFVADRYRILHS